MKRAIIYVAILSLMISTFSCTKDNSTPSKTNILTGNVWKITSKTVNPAITVILDTAGHSIQISDIRTLDSDTVKNYAYKFTSDSTFTLLNSDNAVLLQTTWKLNTDETQLTFGTALDFVYSFPTGLGLVRVDAIIQTITITSITKEKINVTCPLIFNNTNYTVNIAFEPK